MPNTKTTQNSACNQIVVIITDVLPLHINCAVLPSQWQLAISRICQNLLHIHRLNFHTEKDCLRAKTQPNGPGSP